MSNIHRSLHSSGASNLDFSGNSGTQHYHERTDTNGNKYTVQLWDLPDGRRLIKGNDGVWRNEKTGEVFRGGN